MLTYHFSENETTTLNTKSLKEQETGVNLLTSQYNVD